MIHRDLKPRNLLVNSNTDLKICDFGLARSYNPNVVVDKGLSDYVVTRWYRAPELLLASHDYTPAVDLWSVGCIMAELLRGKYFLPGTSTKDQLELIFDTMGTPTEEEINTYPKERTRKLLKSFQPKRPKPLDKLFPNASKEALELLSRLLTFDPTKRLTAEEALDHSYFKMFHDPNDEPKCDPFNKLEFEFENYNLTLQQYKDLIFEEILL